MPFHDYITPRLIGIEYHPLLSILHWNLFRKAFYADMQLIITVIKSVLRLLRVFRRFYSFIVSLYVSGNVAPWENLPRREVHTTLTPSFMFSYSTKDLFFQQIACFHSRSKKREKYMKTNFYKCKYRIKYYFSIRDNL